MATYYFRNAGTAWTTAANWSLTDGGLATGTVPTSADNAYFSNNSGNCVIGGTATCLTLDFTKGTGYTGTLSGSSNITIAGNMTFSTGMTITTTGTITINATSTINGNNKTWSGSVTLSGTSLTYTLGSNITISGTLTISSTTAITITGSYTLIATNIIISAASIIVNIGCSIIINSALIWTTSTAASHGVLESTVGGTQRSILISGSGSMDLSFVDFTDINANTGLGIFTRKGIITNCSNVLPLVGNVGQQQYGIFNFL